MRDISRTVECLHRYEHLSPEYSTHLEFRRWCRVQASIYGVAESEFLIRSVKIKRSKSWGSQGVHKRIFFYLTTQYNFSTEGCRTPLNNMWPPLPTKTSNTNFTSQSISPSEWMMLQVLPACRNETDSARLFVRGTRTPRSRTHFEISNYTLEWTNLLKNIISLE